MEFIDPLLDKYVCEHTANESDLLKKINRETHLEVLQPRMLSGHFQGRVLSMFSKMIRPERILEIGTYTGYSALCLAEGLTPNGKLVTIDINEELAPRVKGYLASSEFSEQIEYKIGAAMELSAFSAAVAGAATRFSAGRLTATTAATQAIAAPALASALFAPSK